MGAELRSEVKALRVFISWSGERSKAIARAVRDWLPLPLHFVKPWMSDADIGAGQRWADSIAKELEASNFGLLCVTGENLKAPWLMFEAGALAKSMDESRVIPIVFDVEFKDLTGPLTQFQARKGDKDGFLDVVRAANDCGGDAAIPIERLNKIFDPLWPQLEQSIAKIPKAIEHAQPKRNSDDILEDLVTNVRSLSSRFEYLSAFVETLADFRDVPSNSEERNIKAHDAKTELTSDLSYAMSWLSPKERDVLRLRFGLDGSGQKTQNEVAILVGLSQSRVCQIESSALRKLRHGPGRPRMEKDAELSDLTNGDNKQSKSTSTKE